MSAHKALQGSETETRELLGGTEENSVSRLAVIDLPSRQINDFLQKKDTFCVGKKRTMNLDCKKLT